MCGQFSKVHRERSGFETGEKGGRTLSLSLSLTNGGLLSNDARTRPPWGLFQKTTHETEILFEFGDLFGKSIGSWLCST